MPEPAEALLEERKGRVALLIFNRPEKRNALSPDLLYALGGRLHRLAQEGEVRAVILRGVGNEAFSAGYDIGRIPGGSERPARSENPLEYAITAVQTFPYPVIAMIRGFALGAGCHLAAACDIRIASESARFGMPPAKLGVVYPIEGYQLFLRLVGLANAKELFLVGRQIDARRALEMGLVQRVVSEAELESCAVALAEEIAEENAPLAVRASKRILNRLSEGPLTESEEREFRNAMAEAFGSADLREARAAFAERRRPRFTGR